VARYHPRQSLDAVIALDGTERLDGLALGWGYGFASPRHPTRLQTSGAFPGFVAYAVLVPGRNVGVLVATSRVADLPRLFGLTGSVRTLAAGIAPR
jgi:hypothetical protein